MLKIAQAHKKIKAQEDEEVDIIDNLPKMKKALFKKLINRVRKSKSLYHLDDTLVYLRQHSILKDDKKFIDKALLTPEQDAL